MVNAAPRSSKLARLKRYIPQFFGTLRLEGRMDDVGQFQADVEAEIPEVRLLLALTVVGEVADDIERGTPESELRIHETKYNGC